MNRRYIWPHSRKMYPKFTCSCRVSRYHLEINTCIDVYISTHIRILPSKHFLVHRFNKKNTKNTPWFFKGTAISAKSLHACIFYSVGSHVCFFINIKSRVCLECIYQDFFVNRNVILFLKWACWDSLIKFHIYNYLHYIISTWGSQVFGVSCRAQIVYELSWKAQRSCDWSMCFF